MPKIETPNDRDREIMRRNGIDPGPENNSKFCVIFRDENSIVLRNYKTRDDIRIHRGDRKW